MPHNSIRTGVIGKAECRFTSLRLILMELEFDRIQQSLPASLNHIGGDANRSPSSRTIGRFDEHSNAGSSAGTIIQYPDLVIDQLHPGEIGIIRRERLPQGRIECIHWTVTDSGSSRALTV